MKNRKKSKEGRFIVGCGGPFGFIIKNENGLYINPKLFCKGYIK
jgi:hypothetical protein